MILNEEVYACLSQKYGIMKDHEVVRYGICISEENQESIVEVYLREIKFFPIPNNSFKFKEVMHVLISRKETLQDLVKKLQRVLNMRIY